MIAKRVVRGSLQLLQFVALLSLVLGAVFAKSSSSETFKATVIGGFGLFVALGPLWSRLVHRSTVEFPEPLVRLTGVPSGHSTGARLSGRFLRTPSSERAMLAARSSLRRLARDRGLREATGMSLQRHCVADALAGLAPVGRPFAGGGTPVIEGLGFYADPVAGLTVGAVVISLSPFTEAGFRPVRNQVVAYVIERRLPQEFESFALVGADGRIGRYAREQAPRWLATHSSAEAVKVRSGFLPIALDPTHGSTSALVDDLISLELVGGVHLATAGGHLLVVVEDDAVASLDEALTIAERVYEAASQWRSADLSSATVAPPPVGMSAPPRWMQWVMAAAFVGVVVFLLAAAFLPEPDDEGTRPDAAAYTQRFLDDTWRDWFRRQATPAMLSVVGSSGCSVIDQGVYVSISRRNEAEHASIIAFPIGDYEVDWGDGTRNLERDHLYATNAPYRVVVRRIAPHPNAACVNGFAFTLDDGCPSNFFGGNLKARDC